MKGLTESSSERSVPLLISTWPAIKQDGDSAAEDDNDNDHHRAIRESNTRHYDDMPTTGPKVGPHSGNEDRKRKTTQTHRCTFCNHKSSLAGLALGPLSAFYIAAILVLTQVSPIYLKTEEAAASQQQPPTQPQQQYKLDCKPGEQRHFNYESATKVWGAANQQVRLRASLRLRCLEAPSNTTLKYLVEVLTLSPGFGRDGPAEKSQTTRPGRQLRAGVSVGAARKLADDQDDADEDEALRRALRAEPVFEEVGVVLSETANRMRRSVSGWFSKTWSSVKDFFGNIFTSSERSTQTRDQVFNENGLDIGRQCRSSNKRKDGLLPIDDSVFDDLEPKYYIGASSIDSLKGTAYEFASGDEQPPLVGAAGTTSDGDQEDDDASMSFFDDPKPKSAASGGRSKRAVGSSGKKASAQAVGGDYEKLLKLPFVFVQSRTGKIIEVGFSREEADLSVRNFKRHLCDLFATNLDSDKSQAQETTPVGQHTAKYLLDSSANSSAIKQTLTASSSGKATGAATAALDDEHEQSNQLVRVLAMVGMQPAAASSFASMDGGGGGAVLGREPTVGTSQGGSLGDSAVSVLRSINSTSNIQLNSRTITPDIDRIQVRVKQVQQISEGRMTSTAGQLGMSLVQVAASVSGQQRAGRRVRRSMVGTADEQQPGDIADLLQVSTSFAVQLVPLSKLGDFANMALPQSTAGGGGSSGGAQAASSSPLPARVKRSAAARESYVSVADSLGRTSANGGENSKKSGRSSSASERANELSDDDGEHNRTTANDNSNNRRRTSGAQPDNGSTATRVKREPLVTRPPADAQELAKTMQEWRQLEARLKFSPSSLQSESGPLDGQLQRLEILRDQVQMRLNEEFMRNRFRRWPGSGRQVAAAAAAAASTAAAAGAATAPPTGAPAAAAAANDLGLSLTQLILDTGITSKRKGSVYTTIEEILELEATLGEDSQEGAVSRLLRDTVRIDKLRSHCRSAIASLDELRAWPSSSSSRLEVRWPFGVDGEDAVDGGAQQAARVAQMTGQQTGGGGGKSRRRLEQCKQVVQLLLRVSERQAADLVLDLMDECNNRMLRGAKDEELGHGPTSRYYRSLRQQFTELLAVINRPTESLLDRLVSRLNYAHLPDSSSSSGGHRRRTPPGGSNNKPATSDDQLEFTYVKANEPRSPPTTGSTKYNGTLLREEDDFNNNDGAGSLLMTITSLAARPSIRRSKRAEIAERLLLTLKDSSCSLFNGPDLDILESMGNFQEPMDEIVGKVVHLARRCRHQDQYLVACVHALQGQLQHSLVQRFLVEQLRSSNVSCTVKSEIVLTLVGAILVNHLKLAQQPLMAEINSNNIPGADMSAASSSWPSVGLNQVDDVLLERVAEQQEGTSNKRQALDRKCLKQLVAYYMGKKRQPLGAANTTAATAKPKRQTTTTQVSSRRSGAGGSRTARNKRAVINDNSFWDEAQCKRWVLPDPSAAGGGANSTNGGVNATLTSLSELADEIDDNSIMVALANNRLPTGGGQSALASSRWSRRGPSQRLIEREADWPTAGAASVGSVASVSAAAAAAEHNIGLRKRHKCTASKTFGPRNAQASLRAEIVNDLVGPKDENKFLARFRLATNFLGNRIDVGRMYLWHQKRMTRAHVNILGKSLWDTSHSCQDKAPRHLLYMPLFDFNLWLVKVSVGLRLQAEMGFNSNCDPATATVAARSAAAEAAPTAATPSGDDELELYPTISLRASGEASAKFVVAKAGMSLASQYGYQGSIRVSRQPESCMSIYSGHQPMNVTFSSWFQLWDSDCHYWGSRNKADPQATKWKLASRKPSAWLEDECLATAAGKSSNGSSSSGGGGDNENTTAAKWSAGAADSLARSPQSTSP